MYNLKQIQIPLKFEVKDISDFIAKYGVEEFHSKSTDIIRNIILGDKVEEKGRDGLYFSEIYFRFMLDIAKYIM